MISLEFVFWFMIVFFALIGYLRGWQREAIALTGLIASVAALSQFGDDLARLVGAARLGEVIADPEALRRQQFWIQAAFHTTIAFFSYQVVVRLAEQAGGGGITERLRADIEKRILGALFGAVNGYLVIGALWGFLEYEVTDAGYLRLAPELCYPFDRSVILRPTPSCFGVDPQALLGPSAELATSLMDYLPQGVFSPTVWLVLFFISFFIVIIALI